MKGNLLKTGLAGLLGFGFAGCLSASVLLQVNAIDDIYLAGQSSSPSVDAGALPAVQGFSPIAGNSYEVQFTGPGIPNGSGITGTVTPCVTTPGCPSGGADGMPAAAPGTNVSAPASVTTTLSQIQYSGEAMFLVGVFLGPTGLPVSQVASIGQYGTPGNTLSTTAASYSPLLGQVFFIGDGLDGTGSGNIQNFIVPTGATQIFLGFADAMGGFSGPAGAYFDNAGSLNVNLQVIQFSSAVPEPGTIALLALGLIGLAIGRKKLAA
jgi:hypothetical protein